MPYSHTTYLMKRKITRQQPIQFNLNPTQLDETTLGPRPGQQKSAQSDQSDSNSTRARAGRRIVQSISIT